MLCAVCQRSRVPQCRPETHARRKEQMKSALKLRSLVLQTSLRNNTRRHVIGKIGKRTRHCSLSMRVGGPMAGLGLNSAAILIMVYGSLLFCQQCYSLRISIRKSVFEPELPYVQCRGFCRGPTLLTWNQLDPSNLDASAQLDR